MSTARREIELKIHVLVDECLSIMVFPGYYSLPPVQISEPMPGPELARVSLGSETPGIPTPVHSISGILLYYYGELRPVFETS